MPQIDHCYGGYSRRRKEAGSQCESCEYREYCIDSEACLHPVGTMPEVTPESATVDFPYHEIEKAMVDRVKVRRDKNSLGIDIKILAPIINACLYDFSHKQKYIISQKISSPDISLQKIGQGLGVTKQAVDKYIDEICLIAPVFAIVLRNRKEYNRWRKRHAIAAASGVFRSHEMKHPDFFN